MKDCPACHGFGVILLTLRDVIPLEYSPPHYIVRKKTYPCPECQEVYYNNDIVKCHGAVPLCDQFKDNPKYLDDLKYTISHNIGNVLLSEKLISFEEKKEEEHLSFGYTLLCGSVLVVRKKKND